jgi:hypothetical protein
MVKLGNLTPDKSGEGGGVMIESLLKSLLNGYFESQKNFPEKHHRGQKFKTSQLLDIAKDCLCTKMPHQLLRTYPSTMCLTKK